MNGNEDDVNLGLTLGYSPSCIRTRLNNNSGAGVNAGPSVDMTFAASDPLSELVWSPHKGLSLKCADCTKADKKPFLLWNVGPSNVVPSPSQSMRFQETDEEKIVDGNLILSHAVLRVDDDVAKRGSLAQSSSNSAGPLIKTDHGQNMESGDKSEKNNDEEVLPKHSSQNEGKIVDDDDKECSARVVQMADMTDGSEMNAGQSIQNPFVQGNENSSCNMAMSKSQCGKLSKECSSNCDDTTNEVAGHHHIPAGATAASEVHAEVQSRAHITLLPKNPWQDETTNQAVEEENNEMINMYSSKLPSLGVEECTAENDLRDLHTEEAWQSGERLPGGSSVPLGTFPNDKQRRGKSKALSNGNFSRRFSNGEDDSHESVESCNSAGLLSKGKRRLEYEEDLVFESKRLKQIDGSPDSMSAVKNDSSFMNWISNMVKGFAKSNEEEDPSLPHVLDHSNPKHASFLQEALICNGRHDSVSRSMGFQTIFQSLYSQNTKLIEARVSKDDSSLEESRGILQADKINIVNSPISGTRKNGSSFENAMSNDKTIPITDVEIHSGLPYTFSRTIPVQMNSVAELGENKASVSLQHHGDREGMDSSESLGLRMISEVNSANPDLAYEGRQVNDTFNKSNLFGSLWITRLSSKTGSSTLNLDQGKHVLNCCETSKYPELKALNSQIQKNPDLAMKHKCSQVRDGSNETSGDFWVKELQMFQKNRDLAMKHKCSQVRDGSNETSGAFWVKELQMFASNTECSVDLKEVHSHNQQNTVLKLNPRLPSETLKRSETIVSVFAQRLDALKHITPSGSKREATCFFCGKSGHTLGDCSEVTQAELDHLLRNIRSYVGAECPCFCIRCFQLDHWAAACPKGSSSRQQKYVEKSTCFNVGNLKLLPIDERTLKFLEKEEHNKGTVCGGGKCCTNIDIRENGDSIVQRSSSSNETQKSLSSNSWENSSGEFHNLQLSNLVSTHVINIPRGIFDAVRRLQVSRTDILKLMKSHVLMPHLEGFFLRLRLGQWEAGLGGTGYYVACIAAVGQPGKAVKDLKKSICVNVGGIKCEVGSQYVSNQDFLEDEFMTWWCRTLRSGGKLPTKDELESKFMQRIHLGF